MDDYLAIDMENGLVRNINLPTNFCGGFAIVTSAVVAAPETGGISLGAMFWGWTGIGEELKKRVNEILYLSIFCFILLLLSFLSNQNLVNLCFTLITFVCTLIIFLVRKKWLK